MRTRNCKRHYCDYCGKGSFFRPTMEKHERRCTANPNRVCGMCAMAGIEQRPIAEIDAIFEDVDFSEDHEVESKQNEVRLREATNDCPACMLAALRQTKKLPNVHIDWKAESKAWMEEFGRSRMEEY